MRQIGLFGSPQPASTQAARAVQLGGSCMHLPRVFTYGPLQHGASTRAARTVPGVDDAGGGRRGLRRGVCRTVEGAGYSAGYPCPPRRERAAAAAGAGHRPVAAAAYGVIRAGHAMRALRSMATGEVGACVADLPTIRLAMSSPLIQLFFRDARRRFASSPHAQAAAG
jgi:hypothetical protein